MYETVKYEVRDGIAYVTVNRPEALNALNSQVIGELRQVFENIAVNDDAKVVILTGEGRSFVAGADIAEMSKLNAVEARNFAADGHALMNYIDNIEKPVIAAVNGFALGGGCELSMACDIRIASSKAKFGQPEVGLGLIPGFGGTQRLARLVGKGMAKMLIYSADTIDAEYACEIGLVEKVVAPENLMSECEALAGRIMAKAPIAVAVSKHCINNGYDMDMKSASQFEINSFGVLFDSEDMKEGTAAFLEKRKAEFKNK
ncbi:MAG: enoyl-CoA hydratase-related protein [Clostridiales bacterium]|nr:enoyl-CoA hydratase-related protein [Clostridiales bacterium]MDD7035195.1 enoyl-CoA hydratase-related protein [Bacillota bacterium]